MASHKTSSFPLYLAGLLAFTFAVSLQTQAAEKVGTGEIALDYTVMPKGPTWTRPAPTTWSSRANVRWQARWGGDGRYMA